MRQKHNSKKKLQTIIQKELLKTLLYSDLFDYPLTAQQLFRFLGIKADWREYSQQVKEIPHRIVGASLYYFLPRRDQLIEERMQKEKISLKKLQKTKRIAGILSYIPTIQYIGVSGSVALLNATRDSDSDLFIITSVHTVWLSRLLVYCVLFALGVKRKNTKNVSNSVCANMFLSCDALIFPKTKRNIYIAHEIAQVLPVVNKNNTYESFLWANKWIQDFFPNISIIRNKKKKQNFFWKLCIPIEYILMKAQLLYMKNRQTRETTTPSLIAFHPINYEKIILEKYEKRVQRYGI